eukprot:scaffold1294_cov167-Amphora_coffeaeformis.AAC.10
MTSTPTPPASLTDPQEEGQQDCVTFLHLDLGIGGAEQLVLQLAQASRALGLPVELWTTRCDADHCFAVVRPETGVLHKHLRVYGRWIPAELMGKGRALCSTLRLWYLTMRWIWAKGRQPHQIVVVDVLPTPLPLLQLFTNAHILFYCHFPDQLLTRSKEKNSKSRDLYRRWLNWMEDSTMPFADTICVNSQFTRSVVQETFASLRTIELPVLYPALDTASLDAAESDATSTTERPIVSLNRYERKKNLELVLEAAQWIRQNHPQTKLPPIIIAGGYDVQNVENVEYRGELGQHVKDYGLQDVVTFRQSISDSERKELLRTALCVVYTPSNEHFGIVPLEAMYCQTPVLACNSGGPKESIVDGKTGFLRDPTADAFGQALLTLIQNPRKATEMGRAGRAHVEQRFGFAPRLVEEWQALLTATKQRGKQRHQQQPHVYRLGRSLTYVAETVVILVLCVWLTYILRRTRVLDEDESLLGGIQRGLFQKEEL